MQQKTQKTSILGKILALFCIGFLLSSLQGNLSSPKWRSHLQTVLQYFNQSRSPVDSPEYVPSIHSTPPLVMKGGDPYIRALMRTITASESNVSRPYHVIYGGKLVEDLSLHPEECVAIVAGPNVGKCSTAAGRYQMLDFTWENKAKRYHPKPSGFWRWKSYSFEPEYQDQVVHDWLKDKKAWNADIPKLLRQGEINTVLRLLSGTWTSLGYGIETNVMSQYLPQIYHNMLQEEL